MSQLYRQTCINGHPATVSPDNGKPWRCGDPECEYFDGADDTAYGLDSNPVHIQPEGKTKRVLVYPKPPAEADNQPEPTLTADQRLILECVLNRDSDYYYSYQGLEKITDLSRSQLEPAVKELRKLGLLDYARA